MKRKELKIDKVRWRTARRTRSCRGIAHPPVFLEKRLQAIEKKGWGSEKERQEISRGGKLFRNWDLDGATGKL